MSVCSTEDRKPAMRGYDYFAALITATPTEEAGLKYIYDEWEERTFDGDRQMYYEASFQRNGEAFQVVCARQPEMGMTSAAVTTMKLIEHFRPNYVIMTGIAAGVAKRAIEEQEYGDIVIPDVVWNYAAGKYVPASKTDVTFGGVGFIPRPLVLRTDPDVLKVIETAISSPENEYHAHIGPMACGATVVASSEILNKQIYGQFDKTAGLDMESYAVMYACQNATAPRPVPIIIKSVCDFADEEKTDHFQKFAAYTSSQFAKLLLEKFLPRGAAARLPASPRGTS